MCWSEWERSFRTDLSALANFISERLRPLTADMQHEHSLRSQLHKEFVVSVTEKLKIFQVFIKCFLSLPKGHLCVLIQLKSEL